MKKLTIITMSLVLLLFLSSEVFASVGVVSVTTNYKSGSSVDVYVKNSHNKDGAKVLLELQKSGKTVSSKTVYVNAKQQKKVVMAVSSKGTYRIKYTFKGKYSYTSSFTRKK